MRPQGPQRQVLHLSHAEIPNNRDVLLIHELVVGPWRPCEGLGSRLPQTVHRLVPVCLYAFMHGSVPSLLHRSRTYSCVIHCCARSMICGGVSTICLDQGLQLVAAHRLDIDSASIAPTARNPDRPFARQRRRPCAVARRARQEHWAAAAAASAITVSDEIRLSTERS